MSTHKAYLIGSVIFALTGSVVLFTSTGSISITLYERAFCRSLYFIKSEYISSTFFSRASIRLKGLCINPHMKEIVEETLGIPPPQLPPVIGLSTVHNAFENAPEPAPRMLPVFALLLTRRAIIATPRIAIKTDTTPVVSFSLT